jgi:protein SYS1
MVSVTCPDLGSCSVVFILLLVARSKLVPDFALTVHFIHLVVTSLYCHALPISLFWWTLQVCSAALMTCLGIWACRWRELRPISFGGRGTNAVGGNGLNEPQEDEVGHSRGRGRGRGRDGGGEYEMVGMGQTEQRSS